MTRTVIPGLPGFCVWSPTRRDALFAIYALVAWAFEPHGRVTCG